MEQIRIVSVNVKNGDQKSTIPVKEITIRNNGIAGENNSKGIHLISLLDIESIRRQLATENRKPVFGEFSENITTEGFPLSKVRTFDKLFGCNIILEVARSTYENEQENCLKTEISDAAVNHKIYCRVIHGGTLMAGDTLLYKEKIIKARIIIINELIYRGACEDINGPFLERNLTDYFISKDRKVSVKKMIIPEEADSLRNLLQKYIEEKIDFVFTVGSIGIGPCDFAHDVVKSLISREIPGIMDLIRIKYGIGSPGLLFHRSIAGIKEETFIYALPGNGNYIKDYMKEIQKTLLYALGLLHGIFIAR